MPMRNNLIPMTHFLNNLMYNKNILENIWNIKVY